MKVSLLLLVVSGSGPSLCGRNWIKELRLLPQVINSVNSVPPLQSQKLSLESILQENEEVFDSKLGTFKDVQVRLLEKTDVQPKYLKARSLPYALRDKVGSELKRLEDTGIIIPVRTAEWAAPIVPVLKPDQSIRICGDFKLTANTAIATDKYPLPKATDIFANLSGGQRFTKLDLKDAYNQLLLHKDSQHLCVINTHRGLYAYQRLPFGISSAPAICQREMEKLLQGIPRVAVSLDDVLVTGKDDQDHLQNLSETLQRMKEAGIRLKKVKCEFMKESIIFLGHRLDANGLYPTEEKLEAIEKAPAPLNVKELRSFLGLLTYYSKFLPNMSTLLEPLYRLLKSDVKWNWSQVEEEAFTRAKAVLQQAVLVHFDPEKELVLACDASPYGIGAILSHLVKDKGELPIAFASRTLSKAEMNYSHLEKEALALVFGVTKFRDYLLGRQFCLITDHRPLVSLFSETKAIPTVAAARIQRWALTLAAFDYRIKFRRGENNGNVDAFSRLPLPDVVPDPPKPMEIVALLEQCDRGPITSKEIQKETLADPTLQEVLTHVMSGWPSEVPWNIKPYFQKRQEITAEDGGILVWCNRIIVPQILRMKLLKEMHDGHAGIVAMKRIARNFVWWPALDADVEEFVSRCSECQEHSAMPPKTTPASWPEPDQPWMRLHIDYAGPLNDQMLLIVVDAYSKWIEVSPVTTATSKNTIVQLRLIFARFGIPECIVSDNGAVFTSAEFQEFLSQNGIKHVTSAPYHPASNGLAERAVRIVKTGLAKITEGDLQTRLARLLFNYRKTPLASSGCAPSELLLKRQLRSRLDLLKSGNRKYIHPPESLHRYKVGDLIYYRNYGRGKSWKSGEIVALHGKKLVSVKTGHNVLVKRHIDQIRRGGKGMTLCPEEKQAVPWIPTPPVGNPVESETGNEPGRGTSKFVPRRSSRVSKPVNRYICH